MLVCISIHADTDTLCFRPKILKELVVQKIVYLAKGRQMLQEYQANRFDKMCHRVQKNPTCPRWESNLGRRI